jgi:hypothetical protein
MAKRRTVVSNDTCQPVAVSRTINASAHNLFDLLARPANHPLIDGSGMLREGPEVRVCGVGDVFTMKMHNDEMGDYEIANHVVLYEPDRRIGWEPVLTAASRAEDQGEIGQPAGHRWTYELVAIDSGSTVVTETYDCTRAPEWLQKAVKGGNRWIDSMTATLKRLDEQSKNP